MGTDRRLLAVPLMLLLVAAGCAAPGTDPGDAGAPGASGEVVTEFNHRAAQIAAAWTDSPVAREWHRGFVPLQQLTVLPPGGAETDEAKQAAFAGWFRTTLSLSPVPPADGEITFPDGDVLAVPLVAAADAWEAIAQGEPDCPDHPAPRPSLGVPPDAPGAPDDTDDPDQPTYDDPASCAVLTVTDVVLGTVAVSTSRGVVDAPAWLFAVEGLNGPVARVAVAPEAVTPVPELDAPQFEYHSRLVNAMGLQEVDGARLAYQLGIGACDTDVQPLVYQTAEVVVVGGSIGPVRSQEACTDQLVLVDVTVTLDAPLGDRAVLSGLTGQPLTFGWW